MPAKTREEKVAKVEAQEAEQARIGDAVEQAIALRAQYGIPDYLTPVVCDLPKYRGLVVCYDTSVPYGKTEQGLAITHGKVKDDEDADMRFYRRMAAMAPRFEDWKPLYSVLLDQEFTLVPNARNITAYAAFNADDHRALLYWLLGKGWDRALEVASGN